MKKEELSPRDVISKLGTPEFKFIENISNEPLAVNYHIEEKNTQYPAKIEVTATLATLALRRACYLKIEMELSLKDKSNVNQEERNFLLKYSASMSVLMLHKFLDANGVASQFLIPEITRLMTDEDLEESLRKKIFLN